MKLEDDIRDESKIETNIPKVSYQSASLNIKTNLITKAISIILIIGSPKASKNNLINLFSFFKLTLLLPYFFLDSTTSSSVKPFKFYHPFSISNNLYVDNNIFINKTKKLSIDLNKYLL